VVCSSDELDTRNCFLSKNQVLNVITQIEVGDELILFNDVCPLVELRAGPGVGQAGRPPGAPKIRGAHHRYFVQLLVHARPAEKKDFEPRT
jgi:hypothetical protein